MKKNVKIFINFLKYVFISVFVMLCCSCANNSTTPNLFNVADLSNRTISLNGPAEKIIALSASDCEVLCAIGAEDKIIGRGTYCDYPSQVKNIKDYGSGDLMNMEQIISAKPDVVLVSKTGTTLDQVNYLENAGINVLVNEADTFEDTYTYILEIGKLVDKAENADKLVTEMKAKIEDLSKKAKEKSTEKKNVYFELSPLQYGLWTAGTGTFMNEICEYLNVNNIFNDQVGWTEISQEQVIKRNPDIIISVVMFDNYNSAQNEILSRSGWTNINAVRDNSIINIENSCITRPGPRLIQAIEDIYNKIYG